ncbi:hypothetical protein [Nonomuraea marmarensis]
MVKITRIETFLVPPRWLFCRVETGEGVVGCGEPIVEGRADQAGHAWRNPVWRHDDGGVAQW